MRKIIVSLNTTLDGFMAGKHCELDWHFKYWDEEMARLATAHLQSADTILLGRITHQAMSRYWPSRAVELNLSREDLGFANMMNEYQKIVCSKTLEEPGWANSTIIRTVSKKHILRLKNTTGRNIIVFGSGTIVSLLMKLDIVDEFIIWIHPIALSEGKPAFKGLSEKRELKLSYAKMLQSGVVLASYSRSNGEVHVSSAPVERSSLTNYPLHPSYHSHPVISNLSSPGPVISNLSSPGPVISNPRSG